MTTNRDLEVLLTRVQGKIRGAMELAVQQVAAEHGMAVRGARGYNAAVKAGLDVISNEIINVIIEMKRFQPNKKQWELIRERCMLFVHIQYKEVFREGADRTSYKNDLNPDNNQINLWLETTYGSINNFIDAEINIIEHFRNDKWENRFWDIVKIVLGIILTIIIGYLGTKLLK